MSNQDKVNELVREIAKVCASCGHAKWTGGKMSCDRKKSQCHSGRVRRWLEEIGRVEKK